MIPSFPLPPTLIDRLAGCRATGADLLLLHRRQVSLNIAALCFLADFLPSSALDLLDTARRANRPAYDAVLGYPYVGAALVRVVRAANAEHPGRPEIEAVVQGIVLAAAVRAGVDFSAPIGTDLHLPTIGSVTSIDGRDIVLRHRDGELHADHAAWRHVRALRSSPVILDDLHPDRPIELRTRARRLRDDEVARWHELFADARDHLKRRHETWSGYVANLLTAVTPIEAASPGSGISATPRTAFGAVVLSRPGSAEAFAVTLVHELQHTTFNGLTDLVELCDPTDTTRYYAPWRADPRPLEALLNGCFAFLGMADFWARERRAPDATNRAHYEFARASMQVRRAIEQADRAASLTADGRRLVAGMAGHLDALDAQRIPEPAVRLATVAVDDHWVSWRLRNWIVEPETTLPAIAAAWRAGGPPPPVGPSTLDPTVETFQESRRVRTLGLVARDPGSLDRTPSPDEPSVDELIALGDRDLARDDLSAAADRFRAAIRRDRTVDAAWVGLALARGRVDRIWHDRPELIRAVHHALAADGEPPDPITLAGWLAVADG